MLYSQFLALASAELSTGLGKQLCVSGATAPVLHLNQGQSSDSVIYSFICAVNIKKGKALCDGCCGTLARLLLRLFPTCPFNLGAELFVKG